MWLKHFIRKIFRNLKNNSTFLSWNIFALFKLIIIKFHMNYHGTYMYDVYRFHVIQFNKNRGKPSLYG